MHDGQQPVLSHGGKQATLLHGDQQPDLLHGGHFQHILQHRNQQIVLQHGSQQHLLLSNGQPISDQVEYEDMEDEIVEPCYNLTNRRSMFSNSVFVYFIFRLLWNFSSCS
jgi:hypothetical protein